MKIQFLRPWRKYQPQQVIEGYDGWCNVLIQRGIARAVLDPPRVQAMRGRPANTNKARIETVSDA